MSKIVVKTSEKKFAVAPDLYGLFFEDINRSGDSGLYPEMLRNRSFEDSIPPERCILSDDGANFTTPLGWADQFNNGEGLKKWMENVPPTPIPAWYAENAVMTLDDKDTLNSKRLVSLKVDFSAKGKVENIGFQGVPLKKGGTYAFYMFAKAQNAPVTLNVSLASSSGCTYDETSFLIKSDAYNRYDFTFTAAEDDFKAKLVISSPESATVFFGFTSLMPTDTYKGHGMRKDLMEMLAGSNSKFMRFPGGCIVEGFTYETAMRFSNTIGPVWERPSHVLMWHYRTTNGLGYHEFLQICEDLNFEPMYVVNCGLTCQGRGPEYFVGDEFEKMLQEALDAIEYAIGDASTPMGRKRAEAGHPDPFKLTYIEIGNENWGEEYFWRYSRFYNTLKAKYPKIKYISNTHTERDGLPTEIADEHFYNTTEFFAENIKRYDDYNRHGPDIFVGEYAVNAGAVTGTLRCALGETMFLMGIENNQDIVKLTAYAPLFQNIDYSAWFPNLIAFDNHRVYGIPTYHAVSMLALNRGSEVVQSSVETDILYRNMSGLPGILSAKGGMSFRNASLDGKPVSISHEIQGSFTRDGDEYTSVSDPEARKRIPRRPGLEAMGDIVWAALGDENKKFYTFEAEIKSSSDNPITVTVWCHIPNSNFRIDETVQDDWNMRSVRRFDWTINGSTSTVSEGSFARRTYLGEDAQISVDLEKYNTYKVVTRSGGFDCYINGELIQSATLTSHPAVSSVSATDGDKIIVKIVNINGEIDNADIILDCEVQSDYSVQLLTGDGPDAMNTIDNPDAVKPVSMSMTGAAREFTYRVPAYSLNILTFKKI